MDSLRLCLVCFLCLYSLGLLFVLLSICLCFILRCFCVNKDYQYHADKALLIYSTNDIDTAVFRDDIGIRPSRSER